MSVMRVFGLKAELSADDFREYFTDYYKSVYKTELYSEGGVGDVFFGVHREAQNCAANPLPLEFGKFAKMKVRQGRGTYDTLPGNDPESPSDAPLGLNLYQMCFQRQQQRAQNDSANTPMLESGNGTLMKSRQRNQVNRNGQHSRAPLALNRMSLQRQQQRAKNGTGGNVPNARSQVDRNNPQQQSVPLPFNRLPQMSLQQQQMYMMMLQMRALPPMMFPMGVQNVMQPMECNLYPLPPANMNAQPIQGNQQLATVNALKVPLASKIYSAAVIKKEKSASSEITKSTEIHAEVKTEKKTGNAAEQSKKKRKHKRMKMTIIQVQKPSRIELLKKTVKQKVAMNLQKAQDDDSDSEGFSC